MMNALRKFLLLNLLSCLGHNALGSKIINGQKVKPNSMLYMASVQSYRDHICGGFLISEDFVLTAAHCNTTDSVVLGTHDLWKVDGKTMRYAVKMCPHPFYEEDSLTNDIMLLKLSRKASLGGKPIKPVQLPKHEMKLEDNTKCTVAGWGPTERGGETVSDLREAEVPIVNIKKCQKAWGSSLPANVICAGGRGTKRGVCGGDSGGPLVFKNLAVGIVSFNNKDNCEYPDIPEVYTDISKFLPWIKEILNKGMVKCK